MNNAYPKWLEHKNLCKQIQRTKEYEIPVKEIGQLLLVKKKTSLINTTKKGQWQVTQGPVSQFLICSDSSGM